jgi:hypothetical protein
VREVLPVPFSRRAESGRGATDESEKPHPLLRKGWATPGCTRRGPADALPHLEGTTRRATRAEGRASVRLDTRGWMLEARGERNGNSRSLTPVRQVRDRVPAFAKAAEGRRDDSVERVAASGAG